MRFFFFLLFISLSQPTTARENEIDRLVAFAKLYGCVRYFHPSDAAASLDWDKFAVYGSETVANTSSNEQLGRVLDSLFSPIAPDMRIYREGDRPPTVSTTDAPPEERIAWQHQGMGQSQENSIYRSTRTNRDQSTRPTIGPTLQIIDAAPYHGMQLELTALIRARVEGEGNQAHIWLRVDEEENSSFFDNIADRPVRSPEWEYREIVGRVSETAKSIVVGFFLMGSGEADFDDFRLRARTSEDDEWQPVALENPGMEAEADRLVGWIANVPAYRREIISGDALEGERYVRMSYGGEVIPEPGDVLDKALGAGWRVRMPLVLDKTSAVVTPDHAELETELNEYQFEEHSRASRVAGIVIAWNVFQHFYPYFDLIGTDWEEVLPESLHEALPDQTRAAFGEVLERLVHRLEDGHGGVYTEVMPRYAPAIALDQIGDDIVVIRSEEDAIRMGDVLTHVDGEPVASLMETYQGQTSGSPWFRAFKSRLRLLMGQQGTSVVLNLKRGDRLLEVEVRRKFRRFEPRITEKIRDLQQGILYVDLSRVDTKELKAAMDRLVAARGIVFDLRGYPMGTHWILQHLTDESLTTAWMGVPQIIYPDFEKVTYRDSHWTLRPLDPRLEAEAVFLTDETAISYSETFLSMVEGHDLAPIVGHATAGANGNVNPFGLPGGYRILWTGMRVEKQDRSPHHLVGIQPDVPAEPTLAGIRAGRDEVLEQGVDVLRARLKD